MDLHTRWIVEVKGVGVMKDEEVKLEEIEVSHTLGGYRSVGVTLMSYTLKYVSLTDLVRLYHFGL